MDVYDVSLPEESWDKDQKLNALKELPSILEMTSHVFFLPSYFIGPQHSLTKFRAFIQRNIDNGDMTGSKWYALKRFMLVWVYFGILVGFGSIASQDFIKSKEFQTMPFLKMSFYYTIWVQGEAARYIGGWLLAEGAVIISGLGYNGTMPDGTILWNGGENVRLQLYETCSSVTECIQAWNIKTNDWAKIYIYKRCRFLNNRSLSNGITVVFLAVWHGFHSGYYLGFFFQFIMISLEKWFFAMVDNSPIMKEMSKYIIFQIATKIIGYLYFWFFLPHASGPFHLMKRNIYLPVLWSTRAMVLVWLVTWPIWKILVTKLLKPIEIKKVELNNSSMKLEGKKETVLNGSEYRKKQ
jgi:lysophospholipid acyltransferase 5